MGIFVWGEEKTRALMSSALALEEHFPVLAEYTHTLSLSLFRTRVRAHTHSERLNLNGRFYPIQAEGKAQLRITPGAVLSSVGEGAL